MYSIVCVLLKVTSNTTLIYWIKNKIHESVMKVFIAFSKLFNGIFIPIAS